MTADLIVTLAWVAVIMAVVFGCTVLWMAPMAVAWGLIWAALAGAACVGGAMVMARF